MRASREGKLKANFLGFLKRSPQFVIPIYQRTYSWTERECGQLWEDILRTGGSEAIPAHFTGSIVYIEKGSLPGDQPVRRCLSLTASSVLRPLCSSLKRWGGMSVTANRWTGFRQRSCAATTSLIHLEEGERGFQTPADTDDKQSLLALMQQKPEAD